MDTTNPKQLTLVGGGQAKYCIDSNVFFSFWSDRRRFPMENYKPLWELLEKKIKSRSIISSEEVYREVKQHKQPDFQNWLRQHKNNLFIDNTQDVIENAQEIINDYPQLYFQKPKNGADPFVIAIARLNNLTVITEETRVTENELRSGRCPAVPNLCDYYSVPCVDVLGFCKAEGYELAPVQVK